MYGVLEAPIPFFLGLPVESNVVFPKTRHTVYYNIDTAEFLRPKDIPEPSPNLLEQLHNDVKMFNEIYEERGENYYTEIFPTLGKTNEREKNPCK